MPRPSSLVQHQIVAEFHRREAFRPLLPAARVPEGVRVVPAAKLPLILREPTWIRFGDRVFHLQGEGLYRLWNWGRTRQADPAKAPEWLPGPQHYQNVIVFRRDILALLGAVATLQHHGHRHIGVPFAELLAWLKQGSLSLTCGPSSEFVRTLLAGYGWHTRPVSLIRTEGPWTGWNDGHVLNELYWPKLKQWVLLDVNAHRMFVQDGRFLSAGDVCEIVRAGGHFDFLWLTARGLPLVDHAAEVLGEFPKGSFGLGSWQDDDAMQRSLGELLAMPLLAHDGAVWFYSDDPAVTQRITTYRADARPLPQDEWFELFYGAKSRPRS